MVNINVDMCNRSEEDMIYIIGAERTSKELAEIAHAVGFYFVNHRGNLLYYHHTADRFEMKATEEIDDIILFNCLKHHAQFIKNQIETSRNDIAELQKKLIVIGDSQMDLYFGMLSPKEISSEIMEMLKQTRVLEKSKYSKWLASEGNDYQKITLSDTSVWTLRLADDTQRYVHIHPGRYSPHTVRVKALQLKTAIAVLTHAKMVGSDPLTIETINRVRKKVLNESPIKSLENSEGLVKVMGLLSGP